MRVVVLGATGNVGLALVPRLAADPEIRQVVGVARRPPELTLPGLEWRAADIARDDLVPLFRGADVVVHLAWLVQPTRQPARLWEVNVGGSIRIIEAVERAGVRSFVFASSVGAYSPGPSDRRVDESWPTNGVATSAYSREKAYVERVIDAFQERQPAARVVRMRPALIFGGPAASHVRRMFLGSLVPSRWLPGDPLPVVPDIPGVAAQAVHRDDVAAACHRVVVDEVAGAYNLAAEPVLTPAVVAEEFRARLVPMSARFTRAAVAASWRARLHPIDPGWFDLAVHSPLLDSSRAARELRWRPAHSATEALRELFEGLRDERGGPSPALRSDRQVSRTAELTTGQGGRESAPAPPGTRPGVARRH